MTKMATMPIYDKKHEKFFFSGTKRPMTMKVDIQHRVLEHHQFCSNDNYGLTLTHFMARSNIVPYAFYGKKVRQWIFQTLL